MKREMELKLEEILIRPMRVFDIDDIYKVEIESFSLPWSKSSFYNEVENNHFAHYLVAESKGKAIGYCGMWLIMDEAHITNVAVSSKYRGKKIGRKLLENMMLWARNMGALRMTLEVRRSNEVAQTLYRKLGFEVTGIRPKYYTDNQEDALIMWVNLENDEKSQLV